MDTLSKSIKMFVSLTTMITGFIWIISRFTAENTKSLYMALEEMRDSINKVSIFVFAIFPFR